MQDLDFCRQILGLTDPWQVQAVEIDQPSNRLDIYLGFGSSRKKGLFGGSEQGVCPACQTTLPPAGAYETITLRHLPLGGLRTYLHVPPAATAGSEQPDCICMQDWSAAASKFTEAMQNYVVAALQATPNNQTAAKLAGISSSEAREISEITGITPAAAAQSADSDAAAGRSQASHDFELIDSGNIPSADHEGWQRIINGDLPIRTDSVALRMLLQSIRSNVEKDPGDHTRRAGAQSLRQFFIKNQQLLKHEVELLRGDQSTMSSREVTDSGTSSVLPTESAPVWQRLINNEQRLDTRVVGLQMMIERVRQSVERNPTDANRVAGARILRQFFAKHQSRLSSEIGQLTGSSVKPSAANPAAAPSQQALPNERDPVWQQLVRGDIAIHSEVISLKMLLERVRQAVNKNPSEGNRVAAAKILRQYFVKNRNRHSGEISQLLAGASQETTVTSASTALPNENHENWQRLINGDIALHTDAVSLKMLLERIRHAIARKPTEANRLAGARMLRQYFIKNQHRHNAEIRALAGDEPAVQPGIIDDEHSSIIPDITHSSWQRLINGELEIMTDAVGLKMMLERIRLSIEHNPSEASRLAGAKILRQYFIKHQNKHRAELNQLRAA